MVAMGQLPQSSSWEARAVAAEHPRGTFPAHTRSTGSPEQLPRRAHMPVPVEEHPTFTRAPGIQVSTRPVP
jgi:hypothetical protein